MRAAEASAPPPPAFVSGFVRNVRPRRNHDPCDDAWGTSPPLATQLSALLWRSALNVARDPYLAGLHVVLTVCVGLVVGSLFWDLKRLNESTAGVQVTDFGQRIACAECVWGVGFGGVRFWKRSNRNSSFDGLVATLAQCSFYQVVSLSLSKQYLKIMFVVFFRLVFFSPPFPLVCSQDRLGVVFLLLLYLSLLCLTSLAAWRKQMSLFVHERASGAYGAVAHLASAAVVDAVACRILPPLLLAAAIRPLSSLREGSMAGLVGGLVAFNLSLAGVLAACGAASKSSQEALAMGCLVVLFSALLSGFLVAKDDLPAGWGILALASPIGRGFEALVANEFG